jgi:hypothetical protein
MGALPFPLLVSEVKVVEPERRVDAGHVCVRFLLPVEPPEINALLFERVVQDAEVIVDELAVRDAEGDVLLLLWVLSHCRCHRRVGLFMRLHAGCWMKVESDMEAALAEALEKSLRVREETVIPGVAAPAFSMP